MRYKGVEVMVIKSKTDGRRLYMIKSPVNGTTRIFENKEYLKNYIDNAESMELFARSLD